MAAAQVSSAAAAAHCFKARIVVFLTVFLSMPPRPLRERIPAAAFMAPRQHLEPREPGTCLTMAAFTRAYWRGKIHKKNNTVYNSPLRPRLTRKNPNTKYNIYTLS
jgi:hypothetical protein